MFITLIIMYSAYLIGEPKKKRLLNIKDRDSFILQPISV